MISLATSLVGIDQSQLLTLRELRRVYSLRGRGGRPIPIDTLRRWANPRRGYRPVGDAGEAVQFPTVFLHGEHVTTREWYEWFVGVCEKERERVRKNPVITGKVGETIVRRAKEAMERMKRDGVKV